MKISDRGGHTKASPGASAILDELTEDRKLAPKVSALLSEFNTMISNQPSDGTPYPAELVYGINIANSNKVDLSYSIHLNKCYPTYEGPIGAEVLINLRNPTTTAIGNRILANMSKLGFINRGLKDGSHLGEINSINSSSMIIEVCFVESKKDVELYNAAGLDKIAHAIANGIDPRVPLEVQAPIIAIAAIEPKPSISYCGHVQNKGWMPVVKDGEICGSIGEGLRLEALGITYFGPGVLKAQTHIQNYGWTTERANGEVLGTMSMGLRLEAIKLWLEDSESHIEYRVHVQDIGWQDWVKDGIVAGTEGKSLRIEAIQIRIE